MNFGFVKTIIDSTQWVLGSIPKIILRSDGQWDSFLPTYEPQYLKDSEETDGCTVWGTLNCVETIMRHNFDDAANYSERFPYILAKVRPPGSDPHTVAETCRTYGFIDDQILPVTDTYTEFIQPDPMSRVFILLGEQWKSRYTFNHEWVFSGQMNKSARVALMKEALMYSPLGISVSAWWERDGLYIDNGQPNNHWCMCFGWNDQGWKVFDSYEQVVKIVSFDHNITMCKRYSVIEVKSGSSIIAKLLTWIDSIFVKIRK